MQKVLSQLHAHTVLQTGLDGEFVTAAQLAASRQIQPITQQRQTVSSRGEATNAANRFYCE